MIRILIALGLLVSSLPAAGQAFQDLATIADGTILYFSSPIRQKGSDQKFYSKIFRWTAAEGVKLAAEVRDPGTPDTCGPSQFYQLNRPQISADGTVFGYTASRPVQVNRFCSPAESNQGIIGRFGATSRLEGNLALSPNGRYAITTTFVGVTDDFHTVTDLSSGVSTIVAGAFNGSSRRVTNEGVIVTPKPSAVILTDRMGLTRVIPTKWAVDGDAIIDPAGTRVIYTTRFGPSSPARLSAINLQTGGETELTTGLGIGNPQITADAASIFFTEMGQLFTIGIGGSNRRQVTNEKETIPSVVVSSDGRVAYAVTSASRLLRIDVASGASTELVSPTPLITASYRVYPPQSSIAAIGSLIDLYGSGLDNARQLTLCGRSVRLQPDILKRFTRFQVPWDLPEGPCQAIVSSESNFEHGIDLTVRIYDPQFTPEFTPGSVVVTNGVIVAYMSGLGPVDSNGLVASGFQCRVDSIPAEVLYAGLAPGFTGFYQVNIRATASASPTSPLACGW